MTDLAAQSFRDLDAFLAEVARGLPDDERARWQLRVHPGVYLAMQSAALMAEQELLMIAGGGRVRVTAEGIVPVPQDVPSRGPADVVVDFALRPGTWQLSRHPGAEVTLQGIVATIGGTPAM